MVNPPAGMAGCEGKTIDESVYAIVLSIPPWLKEIIEASAKTPGPEPEPDAEAEAEPVAGGNTFLDIVCADAELLDVVADWVAGLL